MSSLKSVFVKFKDHLKIPGNIAILKKQEKKIKIVVYCLEKDILMIYLCIWIFYIDFFGLIYMDFFGWTIINLKKNFCK